MSLAAKLPFRHRHAAGFPGLGSQPVPTDADALDYLDRMAAADGASVEVGVATAVDAFVADSKALGVWDSIRSSCILAGARTLAGALVPIKNEGPELWDNPSIDNIADSGTDGAYDAATRTLTNTTGSAAAHPRFRFTLTEDLRQGAEYIIEGRFSGDIGAVYGVRPRNADVVLFVDAETGEFSGTVEQTSASTQLEILLNAAVQSNISATIESMSVREVIAAPTNVADGFVEGDYSRTAGLTSDGTSYIDSGRAPSADLLNDAHIATFLTSNSSVSSVRYAGLTDTASPTTSFMLYDDETFTGGYINTSIITDVANKAAINLVGATRDSSSEQTAYVDGTSVTEANSSNRASDLNSYIFCRNLNGSANFFADATIAFYSIGTSLSLEDLDTAVTNLINRLKFALLVGENPSGLDPDTIDYIVRGYEAGGSLE